jgi:hypothetical protein
MPSSYLWQEFLVSRGRSLSPAAGRVKVAARATHDGLFTESATMLFALSFQLDRAR